MSGWDSLTTAVDGSMVLNGFECNESVGEEGEEISMEEWVDRAEDF